MDGALNLQRLAEMKQNMMPQAGAPPGDTPDPGVAPGAPDPATAPPDPGAPPMDVSLVPPGVVNSAAASAASAANPAPADDDAGLTASADSLYDQLAAADSPEAARALTRQWIKSHAEGARDAALAQLPELAKNMKAAEEEWGKAAGGMFEKHPHLTKHGELMDLLTKEEYGKDPKRSPSDLYGAVADRANGMLNYSKGSPSLPADSSHGPGAGAITPVVPANETLDQKRLREMRGNGGKK